MAVKKILLICLIVTPLCAQAKIWQVGATHTYKTLRSVANRVQAGDEVEIEAGVYENDYVVWTQDDLTIRGVNGFAHLRSRGLIPNGKAIWVIRGENILIENVEFSGARVRDANGAGIRQNGGSLTLNNTYFHDNQFAILTASARDARLTIRNSRFSGQHRKGRFAHGLYVGGIKRFTLMGNHVTDTAGGHHVKSRALENHILYNRIEDAPDTPSSRMLDLSNCGFSIVIGNEFLQRKGTKNVNAIGFGPEQCKGRSDKQKRLYVIHNTLVNLGSTATLVRNHSDGNALLENNLLIGSGEFLVGTGDKHNNVNLPLTDWQLNTWQVSGSAPLLGSPLSLRLLDGAPLRPQLQFRPPVGTQARTDTHMLQIGARGPAE